MIGLTSVQQTKKHYNFFVFSLPVQKLKNSLIFFRNQFSDIILTAYHYAIIQTRKFLKTPLESTGLRPHISLAVDKSTPHRDTNHAIVLLMPVNGKRIAMPLDAPPVYSIAEGSNEVEGALVKILQIKLQRF